jgi:mgtE-like transporter
MQTARNVVARLDALVRADPSGFRAGFVALLIGAVTGLVAGLTLGGLTDTLEKYPGLLLLVPAAIGNRGSIYGAFGSRLGTAIHTGAYRLSMRRDSLVGQNVAASAVLTVSTAVALAVLAKSAAVAFGVSDSITLGDFVVVSVLGGVIASAVVLGITVGVAELSARRGWDLDNVAVPIVTNAGDVVTLPALFLAALLVDVQWATNIVATICAVAGVALLVMSWRSNEAILREVVRQSLPVLLLAGAIDIVAGVTVEGQLADLVALPVLLVVIPPFLSQSGALSGILASRIGTKLHLGLLTPRRMSLRPIAEDVLLIGMYALPVYVLVALSSHAVGSLVGLESPGLPQMLGVVLLAGALTMAVVVVVAYAVEVATFRLGLDPDNYGVPIVTATLDLGGAFALILAIALLGVS